MPPGRRGLQESPAVIFANGEDARSVFDGFTIEGAHGDWGYGPAAAVLCSGSSPALQRLRISRNWGPGLVLTNSKAAVGDCEVTHNDGGVVIEDSQVTLDGCRIDGNHRDEGSGLNCVRSTVTLRVCTVSGNRATRDSDGGGIEAIGSTLRLERCVLAGNSADVGSALSASTSAVTLENCLLAGVADGTVDISDPLAILATLFLGAGGLDCAEAADANDDGSLVRALETQADRSSVPEDFADRDEVVLMATLVLARSGLPSWRVRMVRMVGEDATILFHEDFRKNATNSLLDAVAPSTSTVRRKSGRSASPGPAVTAPRRRRTATMPMTARLPRASRRPRASGRRSSPR